MGQKIACAGNKPVIELYDDVTGKRISFCEEGVDVKGHTNKIFCVRFDYNHPNILYSGGWDRNVVMWDLRQGGHHAGVIYGPLIAGEAIDVDSRHHLLVTGSMHETEGV